ncbi:MAG TPA: hypothetical protein VFF03_06160 [Rhodocyclaceae bacterium]|nr:hypothetical protein [Rhodocyclaceae bacterium]
MEIGIFPKAILNSFWSFVRASSITFGVWLAALLPIELSMNAQGVANEARGYAPNMEPGVVVTLAFFVTLPILAVALVTELVRQWGLGREPLSVPSCIALGLLAAWPVGYSLSFPTLRLGHSKMYMVSALGIGGFYAIRWFWLTRRK